MQTHNIDLSHFHYTFSALLHFPGAWLVYNSIYFFGTFALSRCLVGVEFTPQGCNLHPEIYTQKCKFFTPQFWSILEYKQFIPHFACKLSESVNLHPKDLSGK